MLGIEPTITITVKEYKNLCDDALFLQCLQNGGVDNWCWYSEAVQEYNTAKEEDKD